MTLLSAYILCGIIGVMLGVFISNFKYFKSNRIFRIVSYLISIIFFAIISYFIIEIISDKNLWLKYDKNQVISNSGAIGTMWFYVGTRITESEKSSFGITIKRIIGVFILLTGSVTFGNIQKLDSATKLLESELMNVHALTQIIFGIALMIKPKYINPLCNRGVNLEEPITISNQNIIDRMVKSYSDEFNLISSLESERINEDGNKIYEFIFRSKSSLETNIESRFLMVGKPLKFRLKKQLLFLSSFINKKSGRQEIEKSRKSLDDELEAIKKEIELKKLKNELKKLNDEEK